MTAAILVEPRVLRRVVRRHRGLSGLRLTVHERCYTLPRAELLEIATAAELGVAEADLAEEPILVPRGDGTPPGPAELWRLVFHARVHQGLAARARAGDLTAA